MGRPRKVIEGGSENDLLEIEPEGEVIQEIASDGRAAYIKNGVTILRRPETEKELLADGWKRK